MNFESFIGDAIEYARANLVGTIASIVILLYLLIKRTKVFFILLGITVAGYGVFLIFEELLGLGLDK